MPNKWRRGRDSNPRYPCGYTPLAEASLWNNYIQNKYLTFTIFVKSTVFYTFLSVFTPNLCVKGFCGLQPDRHGLNQYKLFSFCSHDNFLIMSILSSIDTGFVNPGERAWRLMPTGNILWQLKANPDLRRETHHAAFMSLESHKETMYKLSVHADFLQSDQDKIRQLCIVRKLVMQQRNMHGVADHMLKMYDQHLKNIDWLLKTLTQGWSQNMFPMLEG